MSSGHPVLVLLGALGALQHNQQQQTLSPSRNTQAEAAPVPLYQASAPMLNNVFWAHIPKTSTTFGRTFFSYACDNPSDFKTVKTTHPPKPQYGACDQMLADDQIRVANRAANTHEGNGQWGSWYHMHAPIKQAGEPRENVRLVTMLREPAQRLRSAFSQIVTKNNWKQCCAQAETGGSMPGMSWGWDQKTRHAAIDAYSHGSGNVTMPLDGNVTDNEGAQRYVQALEERNALWGCQTKMLAGYGCHESHALTQQEVQRAMHRVASGSDFVGLTERYAESVCLFHVKYGGTVWDFEVEPGETPSFNKARAGSAAAEAEPEHWWHGGDRDHDIQLYALARDRFDQDLAQHRQAMDECLRSLPANSA